MAGIVLDEKVAAIAVPSTWASRVWGGLIAAWGAITGVLPHVLHHVGPLAGTALVAGAGGTLLFGGVGLVASVPFLLRLRRRFGNWLAPAIALAVFAAMFSLSTFVIGPWIRGDVAEPARPVPAELDEHGHPKSTAP